MASISVVIPVGKGGVEYLRKSLGSIPSEVQVVVVDDSAQDFPDEDLSVLRGLREYTHVMMEDVVEDGITWGRSVFRGAPACILGTAHTTGDIIGFMDEDMSLTIPEGLELDDHCINDGDSWGRIERLLTTYENLLVFGTIYDTDMEHTYSKRKAIERNIIWSTEDAIAHHYKSNWADGMVFVRKDFLLSFGGFPDGVGHGGQKFDLCRRAMKFGAIIGMFRDIPYMHYDPRNIQRRERHSGIDPSWYSYNQLKNMED